MASARSFEGDIARRTCPAFVARELIAIATVSELVAEKDEVMEDVSLAPLMVPLRNLRCNHQQPLDFSTPQAATITMSIFILAMVDKITEL